MPEKDRFVHSMKGRTLNLDRMKEGSCGALPALTYSDMAVALRVDQACAHGHIASAFAMHRAGLRKGLHACLESLRRSKRACVQFGIAARQPAGPGAGVRGLILQWRKG